MKILIKPEQLPIVNDGGIGEAIAIRDFNTSLLWVRFREVQLNTIYEQNAEFINDNNDI